MTDCNACAVGNQHLILPGVESTPIKLTLRLQALILNVQEYLESVTLQSYFDSFKIHLNYLRTCGFRFKFK